MPASPLPAGRAVEGRPMCLSRRRTVARSAQRGNARRRRPRSPLAQGGGCAAGATRRSTAGAARPASVAPERPLLVPHQRQEAARNHVHDALARLGEPRGRAARAARVAHAGGVVPRRAPQAARARAGGAAGRPALRTPVRAEKNGRRPHRCLQSGREPASRRPQNGTGGRVRGCDRAHSRQAASRENTACSGAGTSCTRRGCALAIRSSSALSSASATSASRRSCAS